MAFRVGQKVVCVGGVRLKRGPINRSWPAAIRKGEVYTVREVVDTRASHGVMAIRLVEYHHPLREDGWETAFAAPHFRPVVERKTDISIFTKMLDGSKQPARV